MIFSFQSEVNILAHANKNLKTSIIITIIIISNQENLFLNIIAP